MKHISNIELKFKQRDEYNLSRSIPMVSKRSPNPTSQFTDNTEARRVRSSSFTAANPLSSPYLRLSSTVTPKIWAWKFARVAKSPATSKRRSTVRRSAHFSSTLTNCWTVSSPRWDWDASSGITSLSSTNAIRFQGWLDSSRAIRDFDWWINDEIGFLNFSNVPDRWRVRSVFKPQRTTRRR